MSITKTVESFFGPKQVTREEFVKQWRSEFNQYMYLASSTDELNELAQMQSRIAAMAGTTWDRIK